MMGTRFSLEALEGRVLFTAAVTSATTAPTPLTFTRPAQYFTGQSARHAASGDFNHDGLQDLAVVNVVDNTISVLLNLGNGHFAKAQQYKLRFGTDLQVLGPENIAVGDFNGDGNLDLAIVTRNGNTNAPNLTNTADLHDGLSFLFGRGDGTFAGETDYKIFHGTRSIAVGDLNGDGHPDLVITTVANVGVILNNGDGTFSTQTLYTTGTGTASFVTIGDINGDTLPDLVVAKGSTTGVKVLLNKGGGLFAGGAAYRVAGPPISIALADFNGDGKLDMAVSANNYRQGISVLLGNGDGTFTAGPHRSVSNFLQFLVAADFNGDGHADLAAVDFTSSVRTVLGLGDGSFTTPVTQKGGTEAFSDLTADFNNDGKPDIVLVRHDSVFVLLNTTVE